MKTFCLAVTLLVSTTPAIYGQTATTRNPVVMSKAVAPDETAIFRVGENGPHHRVWQKVVSTTNRLGQVITSTNQAYVELATGLNYWDLVTRQWAETKEEIESFPGGAVARHGRHQVIFANDLATSGAIDLQTPDGKRIRSHILGLSYFDTASGQSVLIAEVTNSPGVVVPPNQVLYANAFTDFKTDVRYTYTRAGFEQDVILRERPPGPEEYGLDPATTRLQVLTEFINPPRPLKKVMALQTAKGEAMPDEALDFGVMQIGRGKAFSLEQPGEEIPVGKQWLKLEGRNFLVEEVPVSELEEQFQALPNTDGASLDPGSGRVRRIASIKRKLPQPRPASADKSEMKTAQVRTSAKGFVLDYVSMTTQTNCTFRGDTTYYLSGPVNLNGTNNILEGGAVLKYATNAFLSVSIGLAAPAIQFQASAYRPVIFTAKDDDSVGDPISGSTGTPSGYYADPALNLVSPSFAPSIKYFRIAYARQAMNFVSVTPTISNGQILNCQNGITVGSGGGNLRNVLFSNVRTNFNNIAGATFSVQNVTFSRSTYLATMSSANTFNFVNCIFENVTNSYTGTPTVFGNRDGFYNSPPFGASTSIFTNTFYPFQSIGAGNYYLTNGCAFLNIGTTSIDATLLADLKIKTTYPPITYTNTTVAIDTTLNPQAQRDTDTPDLGYHFEPLDYLVDSLVVTNAILTVNSGTAIACYNEPGIQLNKGSTLISTGTPLTPNWFVRYQSVQEQSIQLGGTNVSAGQAVNATGNPTAVFQFSKFICPAFGGYHLYDAATSTYSNLVVQNCEFWGGQNYLTGSTNTTATLVNNLFWRSTLTASNANNASLSSTLTLTNNLVYGAAVNLSQPSNTVWYAFNNAFDTCALTNSTLTNGYNAYLSCTGRLNPTNVNNIVTNALAYQTGPLGSFYQPTNSPLINKGSTNASLVGLYHFTTQTNQVKETNSLVDIGYHYVAVTNNVPIDTDGDGLADYLEDGNGNGTYESNGDLTDWRSSDTDGDGILDSTEIALGRNSKVSGTNPDNDNTLKLRVHRPWL